MMEAFAALLDQLVYTRSRRAKIALIGAYLRSTPDPDRGWALAALTGSMRFKGVSASVIRQLMEARTDPLLFRLSYDYVGDLAETCALMWPEPATDTPRSNASPGLSDVVGLLTSLTRQSAAQVLPGVLDNLTPGGRYALLKLATGGLRVGVSARLARTALAEAFELDLGEVEEVWHALEPPYLPLFDWAQGHAGPPSREGLPLFRPFMLAHPLADGVQLDLDAHAVEWKWDGIRVQAVRIAGQARLYARSGDDISASFPDLLGAMTSNDPTQDYVLDGELLVAAGDGQPAPFSALQQRLGRKTVSRRMQAELPVFVRAYDLLFDGAEDLRPQPLRQRRAHLAALLPALPPERFDLSGLVAAADWTTLAAIRDGTRASGVEGLMLKRWDSPYVAGRKAGQWFKWKRDPLNADCVLMYAQRGHGKRSSFYSDFTFGAWAEDGQLLPVGKAYFGFTDAELKWLDKWVRSHTTGRFGPVREVEKALVLEIAFDAVQASNRHKSGLALRFPRIARIRADKPAPEADSIANLRMLIARA